MDIKEIVELHNNYLPYNSLTSNENLYDELLHKYIKDDNVNNIALFGGYGSGKSSIIESYTNRHKDINNCKVSLAKYNTNSEVVEENNNKNEYKNIYEEIIKQIFFSVPKKKIPRSKFNYLYKDVFNVTRIAIIVFVVQLLLLTFSKLINFSHLIQVKREIVILLYVIVFIICISIIVYRIIDNNYIDSLKLKNVSLDFKLYDENSNVLDKYLSEIIYIFKKTKIKVVFFEDLDRYNDINIFVELRELNKAINLVLKNYKKSVTFVYAIREDIFDNSYDKFKLFDTSISIVPYASVYNAYDILRKEFNNVQEVLNIQINDEILNSLSYYVKEYRAIQAIVNDFVIFYHRINNQSKGLKISVNCLLYLMVYKNIFTKDFAKIYSHSSIIDKIIEYIKRNDKYNTSNEIYSACNNGEENIQEILNNSVFRKYDKVFRSFIFRGIFEGYLNDSFGDYVSYIFPISISEKDYSFILYVKDNNSSYDKLKWDYALDEPQKVFNRLHEFDFASYKILNDTLFKYILFIYKVGALNKKITKLREPLLYNINFIVRCLEKDKDYKDLFSNIFNLDDCIDLLVICYRNGDKYSLIINMFVGTDILYLEKLDNELIKSNNSIKKIIENVGNEIVFKNIDDKHIVEISVKFDICYKEISKYGFSEYVLRELYEKNKYEISSENILFFLNKFEENDVQDDDYCLSVSVLQEIPNISSYMFSVNNDNFMKYFNNVWLNRKYYKEDDDSFLMLKSLLNGHIDLINTMFDKIDVKIKDISNLDSMSGLELLKRNKIEINISNIQFVINYIVSESKQFINDNIELVSKLEINEKKYSELNKKIINIIESEDKKIKFLKNIIDSLEDSDIINILKSLNPDLIKELKEKGEMLIDNENEIYSSILEKIEYIEIPKKNKSKFMKLKKNL